ncbi:MAG: hypothetical protein E6K32_18570 [Gammaproteobacteria bacterium]|nr:MAG: hypothetical protein E6K32_18570 [Gammaproteobacteria bacterium]
MSHVHAAWNPDPAGKYRNKIGTEVAVEALKDYLKKYRRGADALWRFAKICRVANVMRPYLEAAG